MSDGQGAVDEPPEEHRRSWRLKKCFICLLLAIVCIASAALALTSAHYFWPSLLGQTDKKNASCLYSAANSSSMFSRTRLSRNSSEHLLTSTIRTFPTNLKPKHYRITLKPFIYEARFEGHVAITVLCTELTSEVVLQVKNLDIAAASVGVSILVEKSHSSSTVATIAAAPSSNPSVRLNFTTTASEDESATHVTAIPVTTLLPAVSQGTVIPKISSEPQTTTASAPTTLNTARPVSDAQNISTTQHSTEKIPNKTTISAMLTPAIPKTPDLRQQVRNENATGKTYNNATKQRPINTSQDDGSGAQHPVNAAQVADNEIRHSEDSATHLPDNATQHGVDATKNSDNATRQIDNATKLFENSTQRPANETSKPSDATQSAESTVRNLDNATEHEGDPARRKRSVDWRKIEDAFLTKTWEEDVNLDNSVLVPLDVLQQKEDPAAGRYVIAVKPELEPGMYYTINISYSGAMGDAGTGFYRINYTDATDGTSRWIAAADLQPGHAQEVFPCFEEPNVTSTFEINVAVKENMSCLSNMPEIPRNHNGKKDKSEWQTCSFNSTPSIPTILVSVIVWNQDFKMVTVAGEKGSATLSFLARRKLWSQTGYGLSLTSKIQHFLCSFLQDSLSISKLDIAVLPGRATKTSGKWGLLVFRESDFLYSPRYSTKRETISKLVARELCFSWLTSRAPMNRGVDLWFRQLFGNYLAFLVADNVEPSYQIMDKFVVDVLHPLLQADTYPSAQPAIYNATAASHTNKLFNYSALWKGVCIVRMLDHIITRDVFKKGLIQYTEIMKSTRCNIDDVWTAFDTELRKQNETTNGLPANMTIKQILDNWMGQTGYPILHVTRNNVTGSICIKQEGFVYNDSNQPSLWYVPVSYMREGESEAENTMPKLWLQKQAEFTIDNATEPGASQWVLFNVHQYGVYRVNYDASNWALLLAHLMTANESSSFSAVTRAQLVDDSLNLARSGQLSYVAALDTTQYLAAAAERHCIPWTAFLHNMDFLALVLQETPVFGSFQNYMEHQMRHVLKEVGFAPKANESHLQGVLRNKILHWSSFVEEPSALDWAHQIYRKWIENTTANPINPDFKVAVLCTTLRHGHRKEWEHALRMLEAGDMDQEEYVVLLRCLTCTKDTWLLNRLLVKYEQENAPTDDVFADVVAAMSERPFSARVTFYFLRNRWQLLQKRYSQSDGAVESLLALTVRGLTTQHDIQDVEHFLQSHLQTQSKDLDAEVQLLKSRVDWHVRYYPIVESWLTRYYSAQTTKT